MHNRLIAVLLSLSVVFSCVPAHAADASDTGATAAEPVSTEEPVSDVLYEEDSGVGVSAAEDPETESSIESESAPEKVSAEDESHDEISEAEEAEEEEEEGGSGAEEDMPYVAPVEEETEVSEETDVIHEPEVVQEADSVQDHEDEGLIAETEEVYASLSDEEGLTEEDSASGYIDSVMSPSKKKLKARYRPAGSSLTGVNKGVYTYICERASDIASGTLTSTVFVIPIDGMGLEQTKWTAEELGVDAIASNGSITSEAISAVKTKLGFEFDLVVSDLLSDNPYTLYWFDKTGRVRASGFTLTTSKNEDGVLCLGVTGNVTIYFPVCSSYAADEYEIDPSCGEAVLAARDNALSIVDECAGLSDYEKLEAYKNKICELTMYNNDALNNPVYGDPWQLVWVFDGDSSTNVVCEGYSKAFKYLCDMSTFSSDEISCILGLGEMTYRNGGGLHMWNIVSMDDGFNYLVDVTNTDSGLGGSTDGLFLAGPAEDDDSGNPDDGYDIPVPGGLVKYRYSEDMPLMYSNEELSLGHGLYRPGKVPEKKDIKNAEISMSGKTFVYTGNEICPELKVYYDEKELSEGKDYTVEYVRNTNAGTASVTVTGNGLYSGTLTDTFVITKRDISDAEITLDAASYTADASPVARVVIDGLTLVNGTDFTYNVSIDDENETATVEVTGSGNYTGTVSKPFHIAIIRDLSDAVVTADADGFIYDGFEKKPSITVIYKNKKLKDGTDYTVSFDHNINAGTASYTVTGKGSWKGEVSDTFTIEKKDISEASAVLGRYEQSYDKNEKRPGAEVSVNGKELVSEIDYTISYKNNIHPGTAEALITGTGNYKGEIRKKFYIFPKKITPVIVLSNKSFVYDGRAHKPLVTVMDGSEAVPGTGYDITYQAGCTDAGTYSVSVKMKGDYTGSGSASFTVTKKETVPSVHLAKTSYVYTGNRICPSVTVMDGDIKLDPAQYTVTYPYRSSNAGRYTVKVTLKGNYSGSGSADYTIAKKNVTPVLKMTTSVVYTGKVIHPTVSVYDGNTKLASSQYTVSYPSGCVKAGKYTVKVILKGNYSGNASSTFTITRKKITPVITCTSVYKYSGKAIRPAVTVMDGKTKLDPSQYTVIYPAGRINAGMYSIKVILKGSYSGSGTKIFRIVPAGTSLVKVSALNRGLKVSWKKQMVQTSGYQVQLSTDKMFKKSIRSVTVNGNKRQSVSVMNLKGNTRYYLRVRTFKRRNGVTVFSSWSGVKNIVTKK